MDPLDPATLAHDLSAFADGELDVAATQRLLRHLVADPAAVADLRRFQQMTHAARRTLRDAAPAPSDALRDSIRQLVPDPSGTRGATRGAPVLTALRPGTRSASTWAWASRAAVAASLLLVGASVGQWAFRPAGPPTGPVALGPAVGPTDGGPNNGGPTVLPADLVVHAEQVHANCSRLALGLHATGYPADVAALADTVEQDLRGPNPYPNLAPIGFRYRGAGPCGDPLADTAHLLYRSVRPGSVAAVSLFVQPSVGRYPLAPGRLYTVSVAQSPFPMLAWRTDRVVYFLLADDAGTERAALALIRAAPASGG